MTSEETISPRDEIKRLEKEKNKLLEVVSKLNRKIKYKELELNALGPILEKYKSVDINPIRRKLNAIEFKISTQAISSKKERDLVKKAKEFRKEYNRLMKIERVRRRKTFIEKDLKELMEERDKIDTKLKELRENIKNIIEELRKSRKKSRAGERRGVKGRVREGAKGEKGMRGGTEHWREGQNISQPEDMYVTLEDIVEIEKKKKPSHESPSQSSSQS